MSYRLEFYNAAVKAEIEAWPRGIHASFVRIAEQMVESGPNLGLPYTRAMGNGLFEIRARGEEGTGRAFSRVLLRVDRTTDRDTAWIHQEDSANAAERARTRAQTINLEKAVVRRLRRFSQIKQQLSLNERRTFWVERQGCATL